MDWTAVVIVATASVSLTLAVMGVIRSYRREIDAHEDARKRLEDIQSELKAIKEQPARMPESCPKSQKMWRYDQLEDLENVVASLVRFEEEWGVAAEHYKNVKRQIGKIINAGPNGTGKRSNRDN